MAVLSHYVSFGERASSERLLCWRHTMHLGPSFWKIAKSSEYQSLLHCFFYDCNFVKYVKDYVLFTFPQRYVNIFDEAYFLDMVACVKFSFFFLLFEEADLINSCCIFKIMCFLFTFSLFSVLNNFFYTHLKYHYIYFFFCIYFFIFYI